MFLHYYNKSRSIAKISPTEHDFKGHILNIIDEMEQIGDNDVKRVINQVRTSILHKDTLRASDYRKALLLAYIKLKECNADNTLLNLNSTAVRISKHCMLMMTNERQRQFSRYTMTHFTIPLLA